METQNTYSYSSKPKAVSGNKKSRGGYRPTGEESPTGVSMNIMFDPRVVRGSTYSIKSKNLAVSQQQEKENRRRRMLERKSDQNVSSPKPSNSIGKAAPPPVAGHKHIDIQTDTYLEELTDKVPEVNEETQTDEFMDRPAEPLFMPAKIGVDAGTQVDVDELFDFDLEVEPILEVLVGKTLEHAMMEVMEEEELAALREHQRKFEQERNIELAEVQRLEAESKRRHDEKERRVKQQEEAIARENQVMGKVAARAFAKDTLGEMNDSVFGKLLESGHLYDPIVKEIEDTFLPWIHANMESSVDLKQKAKKILDSLIVNAFARAKENYQNAKQQYEKKQEEERMERERSIAQEAEQDEDNTEEE